MLRSYGNIALYFCLVSKILVEVIIVGSRVIDEIKQFKADVNKGGMPLVDYVDIKKSLKSKINCERDKRIKVLKQLYLKKKITSEDYYDIMFLLDIVTPKYKKILADC